MCNFIRVIFIFSCLSIITPSYAQEGENAAILIGSAVAGDELSGIRTCVQACGGRENVLAATRIGNIVKGKKPFKCTCK